MLNSFDTIGIAPSYSSKLPRQPRLNVINFGDGYEQSSPDGINYDMWNFSLVFSSLDDTDCATIVNFLEAQGGYLPFLWTPPAPYNANQLRFKCKTWNHEFVESNNNTVTATFEQTFSLSQ